MPNRPRVVAFDVVETLMSLEPLRHRFREVGAPPELLERWFDRLLRDGMALTLAGYYEPFPTVAAAALRTLTRGAVGDDAVEHVLAGFAELPAHPDVEPALRLLAEHGIRVVCLSNGAARTAQDFLQRTGLATYVEQVLSVADVRSWKPPARVYHYALEKTGCVAEQAALVAVHAFDCHGAHRVGLTTGWASRLEGHYAAIFAPADVVGADLVEVAQGLVVLPAGS
ncbi:2-haloacid dehalogenase [Amycolatopsis echigonensis]|uniref:2-haloacid dehalogenase n=2 Tax=Pseudonocardiaceae TaxID=2070 RepID=A0A2N3WJK4_9PSEU|nr:MULTISPECIES: haloacid dehalogenase type II [Pseudonocardiaceae]AEA23540.1 haloacid dehalogenase, type II [Pseudonocardia dioxanivorans CB1190]PKV94054.1 2-haloacid dehalogenase [Amycolatopsis niigatensis]